MKLLASLTILGLVMAQSVTGPNEITQRIQKAALALW